MVFGYLCVVLTIVYAAVLIRLWWSWSRMGSARIGNSSHQWPLVTVLIPARNEATHLRSCIEAALDQNYPGQFEVCCLNNHSTDGTQGILDAQTAANFRGIDLSKICGEGTTFKKETISYGVNQANGEIILCLDADCTVNPDWITTMVSHMLSKSLDYLAGPVKIRSELSLIAKYQQLDFAGLQVATGGGLTSGLLLSSNGANHAFTKRAFDRVQGYSSNATYRSGDDIFLVQGIADAGGQVDYLLARAAIATTVGTKGLGGFFAQRIRWASKAPALIHASTNTINTIVALTSCTLLALLTAACFSPTLWPFVFAAWLTKTLGDLFLLIPGVQFFRIQVSSWQWLLAVIANPIHISIVAIAALTGRGTKWKGRPMESP